MHLFVFLIRICHDARSPERQKKRTNRGYHTLCFLSSEDVGSLAKCDRILLAGLVCSLPLAVVVFIYLLALLVAERRVKGH